MVNSLVSVIMPSYNTAKYIEKSVKSVLNQTYSNLELIIVDDCSTDNTDEIIKKIDDKRVVYLKNDTNSGAAISRNRALKCAKGKWIAFLDSDDLWMPEKLEKQIEFMEKNNFNFTYTNYEEIDENDNLSGIVVSGPKRISKIGMYNYCWPGCLTVMYNKDIVGNIQIADIKKNNDYAMWLNVSKKSDCFLLNSVLAKYRIRSGSISRHGYHELIKWHYKLFRDAAGNNVIASIILTFINIVFGFYKKLHYKKLVK